jgi:hypothetical protein
MNELARIPIAAHLRQDDVLCATPPFLGHTIVEFAEAVHLSQPLFPLN